MPADVLRCGSCAFFVAIEPGQPPNAGDCHANPPTSYPASTPDGGAVRLTVWPLVQADDFCGCWEGKEEPTPDGG